MKKLNIYPVLKTMKQTGLVFLILKIKSIKNILVLFIIYTMVAHPSLLSKAQASEEEQAVHFDKMDMGEAKNKKTVFIHIGLPKTGSSYLQHAFAYNASLYKEMGLNYPSLGVDLSRPMPMGNGYYLIPAPHDKGWISKMSYHSPEDVLNWLDPSLNHLISSEHLISKANYEHLKKIYQVFSSKFEVKFICFVRDFADYICSYYAQYMKSGRYKDLPEIYIDELIAMMRNHLNLILKLASIEDHLLVLINYDAHRKTLLETFDKIVFGKEVSVLPPCLEVNPSPDCHQMMVLRLVHALGLSDYRLTKEYLARGIVNKGTRFELPEHLIKKIYNELDTEVDAVNYLLPSDEQLGKTTTNRTGGVVEFPFNNNDIEYLKKLIEVGDYQKSKSLIGRVSDRFRDIILKIKIKIHFMITR